MWIRAVLVAVLVILLIVFIRKRLLTDKKYPNRIPLHALAAKFIQSGLRVDPDMFMEVLFFLNR